jgi:hypothetical protein
MTAETELGPADDTRIDNGELTVAEYKKYLAGSMNATDRDVVGGLMETTSGFRDFDDKTRALADQVVWRVSDLPRIRIGGTRRLEHCSHARFR